MGRFFRFVWFLFRGLLSYAASWRDSMAQADNVFSGSIPELYDRHLGPLLFEPYAKDLAARVAALQPQKLLELAAGTGIATRALARALPGSAGIVATDLNEPMIAFAAARTGADAKIVWRQADALQLPFDEASFDLVVCQFGVMFFPDKTAAYRETHRVLKPGGHFLFSVWDRLAENELSDAINVAVAALFPQDPPRFIERTPFGYFDSAKIRSELRAAGFRDTKADVVARRSRAASLREAVVGLCQGSPLRNEIEARDPAGLGRVTEAVTAALAQRFGSGPLDAGMQAIVFTAAR